MDKEKLRDIIYILIAIIFSIIAVKLVIWLLPNIIIAILAYFIYKKIKNVDVSKKYEKKNTETKVKKNKRIIIDEEKD